MRKIITALFLASWSLTVLSQTNSGRIEGASNTNSASDFLANLRESQLMYLFNPDSYEGIKGSPFFSDSWTYAHIVLEDNRAFDSVLLRLNLYENKVHFKNNNGKEQMVAIPVKKMIITDASSAMNNTVFLSGYPEYKDAFFQVITGGNKASLLKKKKIIIKELKILNLPDEKSFELEEQFFVLINGRMYKESKNCSTLTEAFGNDSKVNGFISANNIKCNKESDLKKLLDFYNSY